MFCLLINLTLKLSSPKLPKDYRPVFVSFIKSALESNYRDMYSKLYTQGPYRKSFTFSVSLPKPQFENDCIILADNEVKCSFSSCDELDTLTLYNAFQKSKERVYPLCDGNSMELSSVSLKPVPVIRESYTDVKFLSPLIVRRHIKGQTDKYFVYDDEDFQECLAEIVSRQLFAKTFISIEPISPRKTVVRSFGTNVRASLGTYRLYSTPDVLNLLLNGGIGSRRSEGFGHFTVIGR